MYQKSRQKGKKEIEREIEMMQGKGNVPLLHLYVVFHGAMAEVIDSQGSSDWGKAKGRDREEEQPRFPIIHGSRAAQPQEQV